ncbi:MAG: hypothetical protein OQJ99_10375 [Rhodospirillales bacterium]|nr:hypothetical protein [Rhodospirillales bacterium]MCW8862060.1 hypothetical protein [Rhodospirillales bacterium]MCW8953266.1 hypothetical protein [Rhodospirillales bacterium]MCW8971381.1 hypothetical protein [Rhodospirillales bacterium]MCW9002352.1 hypothetical protein [Rhodospirillales bacterium]
MRITVKLYAMLGKHLPPGAEHNVIAMDVPDGVSPREVLDGLGVPPEQCHLVLIDGVYVEPERRSQISLAEGNALAVWPPIAGG